MIKKIVIAIDGYSSTGKSTIAKELAKELQYIYVDSGAMYRAVTLFAMNKDYISSKHFHSDKLIDALPSISISFLLNSEGKAEVSLNGESVEKHIRSLDVSNLVSKVSTIAEVRKKLVSEQHKMGKNKGIVMDGRDIGTVVFPDAELKIFMISSPETRAKRRFKELTEKGDSVTYEEVLKNVMDRDYLDTTRKESPLIKAKDAIEIDNSNLTKEEQFQIILDLVKEKLS